MPKQSLAQFGQTIKAKHPEYADLADEDLGRKVLAKYPQYGDMVDPGTGGQSGYDPAADAAAHAAQPFGATGTSGVAAHPATSMAPGDSPSALDRLVGNDTHAASQSITRHATGIPAGLTHAVRHPWDTFVQPSIDAGKSALDSVRAGDYSAAGQHALDAIPVAGPWARAISNEAHNQGVLPAIAGAGIDVLGGEALGKVPVGDALSGAGSAAKSAGKGIIHDTIGTLKKDVRRGNDPAQAYFDEGIGPSMSLDSIARKSGAAKSDVGARVGQAYDDADQSGVTIPARKVYADAIRPPIDNMLQVKSGPGGGPTGPVKRYARSFDPVANDAAANVDYAPSEVWGMKRNIAQNTSWSDPTMLDLKSVRQQNVGALQGVLNDAVPSVEPLNSRYGSVSALEERASARAAQPNSIPLTKLVRHGAGSIIGSTVGALSSGPIGAAVGAAGGALLDSVPVKTTLASGLYRGGSALDRAGQLATEVPTDVTHPVALLAPGAGRRARQRGTSASR